MRHQFARHVRFDPAYESLFDEEHVPACGATFDLDSEDLSNKEGIIAFYDKLITNVQGLIDERDTARARRKSRHLRVDPAAEEAERRLQSLEEQLEADLESFDQAVDQLETLANAFEQFEEAIKSALLLEPLGTNYFETEIFDPLMTAMVGIESITEKLTTFEELISPVSGLVTAISENMVGTRLAIDASQAT
jgi:hypothetical protein